MRWKLRWFAVSWFLVAHSMKNFGTISNARELDNTMPCSAKACGIETDTTSPPNISANSSRRTGARFGSIQLVTQALSIQAHQTASIRIAVCSAPSGVRCASSPCDSCVMAKIAGEVEEQLNERHPSVPAPDPQVIVACGKQCHRPSLVRR